MTSKRILDREEYERIEIGPGENALAASELARLEAEWRAMTGKKASGFFDYGSGYVMAKNWVGALSVSGVTLQVSPRGVRRLSVADQAILDRNIGDMLRLCLSRSVSLSAGESSERGSRFERAVEALCDLVLAARRKHIMRHYRSHNEVTRSCRGRLVFPQQSLNELRHPGQFVSQWVDLGEDGPENRFLKAALEFCQHWSTGRVRRRVDEVLVDLDSVSRAASPTMEYTRIRVDRLSQDYRAALSLAKSLLEGEAAGLFAGSLNSRTEVIFMPQLFQSFVARLSREIGSEVGFSVFAQRGGRYLGAWASGPAAGKHSFEVIPDVELAPVGGDKPMLLLDAKWKTLQLDKRDLGISEQDVYQMTAYGKRFDCERAVLVYPWVGQRSPFPSRAPTLLIGSPDSQMRIEVVCIPLLWNRVPDAVEALREALQPLTAA